MDLASAATRILAIDRWCKLFKRAARRRKLKSTIERLQDAITQDDESRVVELLDGGYVDNDHLGRLLGCGLVFCASFRKLQLMKVLLNRCVNNISLRMKDSTGRTALLISIEDDFDPNLASELIHKQGTPVNTPDNDGRTPMMQAIWKGQTDILTKLVRCGDILVNAVDKRRRNALHHLMIDDKPVYGSVKTPDVLLQLYETLVQHGIDVNATDSAGRTCLHYAARYGRRDRLVARLVQRGVMRPDSVNIIDERRMTPLHLAAEQNDLPTMKTLLDAGANITAESEGGWTPLHIACGEPQTTLSTIRFLMKRIDMAGLQQDEQLHRRTWTGKTALHIATETGNPEIITYLLSLSKFNLSRIHPLTNSALFTLAGDKLVDRQNRREILKMFAPWSEFTQLEEDAREAAKSFKATVIDFDFPLAKTPTAANRAADRQRGSRRPDERRERKESRRANTSIADTTWRMSIKRHSVYDLVYANDPSSPKDPAISCLRPLQVPRQSEGFRWIHLPANNVSWCRDLIGKHFIESYLRGIRVHGPSELSKSFVHYERRGKRLHSRYMTPVCETVLNFQRPNNSTWHGHRHTRHDTDSFDRPNPNRQPHTWHGTKYNNNNDTQIFQEPPESPKIASAPVCYSPTTPHASEHNTMGKIPDDGVASSMYLFMPYLHYETFRDLVRMQTALEKVEKSDLVWPEGLVRNFAAPENAAPNPNEKLYAAHLCSNNPSLHIRRTLDQFFYQNIDTHYRDFDQVLQRFQMRQRPHKHATPRFPAEFDKLIMVDQLWMWVLGEDLVVTAFPPRWEPTESQKDRLNVFEGIVDSIDSGDSHRVYNVHELAMTIVGHCYGMLDRHDTGNETYQFLDKYKISVGSAVASETTLFQHFLDTVSGTQGIQLKRADQDPSKRKKKVARDLLDIKLEIQLLTEVKDILDELEILALVLQQQCDVLDGMVKSFDSMRECSSSGFPIATKTAEAFMDHRRLIQQPLDEIARMHDQAKGVQKSILALLDLKQKHANATEAHSTARQGQTVMVFTVVTVFFLPLSFIAAFFAIDMNGLPRDDEKDLPIDYVYKWLFGLGLPIALLCVVTAFSAGYISKLYIKVMDRVKHVKHRDAALEQELHGPSDESFRARHGSVAWTSGSDQRGQRPHQPQARAKVFDEESGGH